jgi:hypothetical protein
MDTINEAVRKRIQNSIEFEMSYLEEHVVRAMGFIQTSTLLQEDKEASEINNLLEQLADRVTKFKCKKII